MPKTDLQMFDYMQTDLRDEKNILMDGSKLSELLVQNGFTDIISKSGWRVS